MLNFLKKNGAAIALIALVLAGAGALACSRFWDEGFHRRQINQSRALAKRQMQNGAFNQAELSCLEALKHAETLPNGDREEGLILSELGEIQSLQERDEDAVLTLKDSIARLSRDKSDGNIDEKRMLLEQLGGARLKLGLLLKKLNRIDVAATEFEKAIENYSDPVFQDDTMIYNPLRTALDALLTCQIETGNLQQSLSTKSRLRILMKSHNEGIEASTDGEEETLKNALLQQRQKNNEDHQLQLYRKLMSEDQLQASAPHLVQWALIAFADGDHGAIVEEAAHFSKAIRGKHVTGLAIAQINAIAALSALELKRFPECIDYDKAATKALSDVSSDTDINEAQLKVVVLQQMSIQKKLFDYWKSLKHPERATQAMEASLNVWRKLPQADKRLQEVHRLQTAQFYLENKNPKDAERVLNVGKLEHLEQKDDVSPILQGWINVGLFDLASGDTAGCMRMAQRITSNFAKPTEPELALITDLTSRMMNSRGHLLPRPLLLVVENNRTFLPQDRVMWNRAYIGCSFAEEKRPTEFAAWLTKARESISPSDPERKQKLAQLLQFQADVTKTDAQGMANKTQLCLLLDDSLNAQEAAFGQKSLEYVHALWAKSAFYANDGDWKKAISILEQALELRKDVVPKTAVISPTVTDISKILAAYKANLAKDKAVKE